MSNKKEDKKKNGIFLNNTVIVQEIAMRTSLTQPQVKECIDVMFDVVKTITLHPNCNKRFEFKLGDIGKLTLKPRAGRKAGLYTRPSGFSRGEPIEEILEEEEPSYQNLTFSMFPTYKKALNKISRERSSRELWEKTYKDEDGNIVSKKYKGWKARNGSFVPLDSIDEV